MEFEFDYFPVIETDRLIMREINLEDQGALYKIFSSETVMKYYGMFPINELKQAENLILSFRDGFDEEKSIRWASPSKRVKFYRHMWFS